MKTIKECRTDVLGALKRLGFQDCSNTVEKRDLCVVNAKAREKVLCTNDDWKNVDVNVFIRKVDKEDGSKAVAVQIGYTLQFDRADKEDQEARVISQKNFWSPDFFNLEEDCLLKDIRKWLKEKRLDLYYGHPQDARAFGEAGLRPVQVLEIVSRNMQDPRDPEYEEESLYEFFYYETDAINYLKAMADIILDDYSEEELLAFRIPEGKEVKIFYYNELYFVSSNADCIILENEEEDWPYDGKVTLFFDEGVSRLFIRSHVISLDKNLIQHLQY